MHLHNILGMSCERLTAETSKSTAGLIMMIQSATLWLERNQSGQYSSIWLALRMVWKEERSDHNLKLVPQLDWSLVLLKSRPCFTKRKKARSMKSLHLVWNEDLCFYIGKAAFMKVGHLSNLLFLQARSGMHVAWGISSEEWDEIRFEVGSDVQTLRTDNDIRQLFIA